MSHLIQSRREKSIVSWLFQCKNNLRLLFIIAFIQIFLSGFPKVLSFNLSLNKKSLRYENRNRIVKKATGYHNANDRLKFSLKSEQNDSDDDFVYIRKNAYFNELGFKSIKKVEKGNSISSSDNTENESMKGLLKYFVPGFVGLWAAGYGAVFLAEISGNLNH
jgi:hypothetical protein